MTQPQAAHRGRNLNFFQKWVSNIVSMGGPEKAADVTVNSKGAAFGEIAYRNDYITTMRIKTFDMAAQHINTTTMYEVWPSQIGDVTLGWAQNDEIARVTINFQVRNWVAENHQLPEGQSSVCKFLHKLILNLIQNNKIVKIAEVVIIINLRINFI